MVLLDTKVVNDAIIDLPTRLFVIKNGRVTVETTKTVTVNR
jgi:cytosine deaminase